MVVFRQSSLVASVSYLGLVVGPAALTRSVAVECCARGYAHAATGDLEHHPAAFQRNFGIFELAAMGYFEIQNFIGRGSLQPLRFFISWLGDVRSGYWVVLFYQQGTSAGL